MNDDFLELDCRNRSAQVVSAVVDDAVEFVCFRQGRLNDIRSRKVSETSSGVRSTLSFGAPSDMVYPNQHLEIRLVREEKSGFEIFRNTARVRVVPRKQ